MRAGDQLLGSRVILSEKVAGGYTQARRVLVELADGRRVFVKQAVDQMTTDWLLAEKSVYEEVIGPFIPEFLGFLEEPWATLVLEDLSSATWPPPWTAERVDGVLTGLDQIARHPPPGALVPAAGHRWVTGEGWADIAEDPAEFLALGLCGADWLADALPVLLDAERTAPTEGSSLLHGDIRSDNLCLRSGRAVFVDWNCAAVGNPLLDIAFWLPSLAMEGGPLPDDSPVPVPAELAALVAGFFGARAGHPKIPHAPRVRAIQLDQLRVALPWAARALDLPPPA